MAGSFACGLAASILFDYDIVSVFPGGNHGRILVNSCLVTAFILWAFDKTGGFMQPVIATARTYGCRGVFRNLGGLDHFIGNLFCERDQTLY